MFTFAPEVPENIRTFLISLLAPWIDRNMQPLFSLETMRFGLVTFRRDPWPMYGDSIVVAPAGEVDLAALQAFSATF